MEGAAAGLLRSRRWGKGKLLELYSYMRAGGDYVSVFGEPGMFVRQKQQWGLATIEGFGPAATQTVRLSGDASRSADGVLHYEGHASAPSDLLPEHTYLIDAKAGG